MNKKDDEENALGVVNNCIKHAMAVKQLEPKLEHLDFDELIETITAHLYEKELNYEMQ